MNAEIDFAPLLPLEWLAVLAAISAAAAFSASALASAALASAGASCRSIRPDTCRRCSWAASAGRDT